MLALAVSTGMAVAQDHPKMINFETDEWLSSAKFAIGDQNRTAHLELDFNSEVTMLTSFNCKDCKVKVYDKTESSTYKPGMLDSKELIYQRSKIYPSQIFKGSFGSDYLCFNGNLNTKNCTSSADENPELFMIETLPNDLKDGLYAGMVGLSVDPDSKFTSIIEYLDKNKLVDAPIVSIGISKYYGRVSLGGYHKDYLKDGKTSPLWVPMRHKKFSGGWLGGWIFNSTNVSVGMYQLNTHDGENDTKPIYVMLTSESDHGFTLVSGHHRAGEYFIGNITHLYNKTGQD